MELHLVRRPLVVGCSVILSSLFTSKRKQLLKSLTSGFLLFFNYKSHHGIQNNSHQINMNLKFLKIKLEIK